MVNREELEQTARRSRHPLSWVITATSDPRSSYFVFCQQDESLPQKTCSRRAPLYQRHANNLDRQTLQRACIVLTESWRARDTIELPHITSLMMKSMWFTRISEAMKHSIWGFPVTAYVDARGKASSRAHKLDNKFFSATRTLIENHFDELTTQPSLRQLDKRQRMPKA